MKLLNIFIALIVAIPASAIAQPALEPCGTLTQNTKLHSDCRAPLNVGADNITIDLNGFTVRAGGVDEPHGDIDLLNRTGVTITNGKVEGQSLRSIHIEGGRLNRITNMTLIVPVQGRAVGLYRTKENFLQKLRLMSTYDSVFGISITESDKNRVDRVTVEGVFGIGFAISGDSNRITRSSVERAPYTDGVVVVNGKGNVIEKNEFRCGYLKGVWLLPGSEDTLVKSNSINNCPNGIYVEGPRSSIEKNKIMNSSRSGIYVTSLANTVRLNNVQNSGEVDMVDTNADCGSNTWWRNVFATDSEGDGPDAGCIR